MLIQFQDNYSTLTHSFSSKHPVDLDIKEAEYYVSLGLAKKVEAETEVEPVEPEHHNKKRKAKEAH